MADPTKPVEQPDGAEGSEQPKISKGAAKKAEQKAAKAAKKAEHAAQAAKEKAAVAAAPGPQQRELPIRTKEDASKQSSSISVDHDPMDSSFKVGWLKDVYNIKPVGDQIYTRFPPEPNGFLHIGHAKAIAVNFGFAKFHNGKCNLRYDDTNPEKEEEVYFKAIKEIVEWLGYAPQKVTHASDQFDRLYELAEILIKNGKAYACSCSKEEIHHQKGGKDGKEGPRYECPHRHRPIEESLSVFRDMRDGKYKAREAVIRMKMKLLDSGNPYMWDTAAYRIASEDKSAHARTGDKWKIYPTYDFAHCLCDALEGITHSLCTMEFQTARESYNWLVDELKEHLPAIPQQREYGRLNITGTVLSKRKILSLVSNNIVRGWDDPRLYTLIALRRRGIPPGAIRAFIAELGVSDSQSLIQTIRLETITRKYLERTVPRLMVIPDPIKVIIEDLPENHNETIALDFLKGGDPSTFGSHAVPFTREILIDRSDFRTQDDKDFFRLTPSRPVGLLNVPHPIAAKSFTTDPSDPSRVTEIRASYLRPDGTTPPPKPKAFIQWVAVSPAHKSPIKAEVRLFRPLFRSLNPDAAEGGFLEDVSPESEEIFPDAAVEVGFREVKSRAPWPKDFLAGKEGQLRGGAEGEGEGMRAGSPWDIRFQGVRVAYFTVDTESVLEGLGEGNDENSKLVLNQIVPLKEDTGKGG